MWGDREFHILELRYEKHENQMKGCAVELRVSDLQMNVCRSFETTVCVGQQ